MGFSRSADGLENAHVRHVSDDGPVSAPFARSGQDHPDVFEDVSVKAVGPDSCGGDVGRAFQEAFGYLQDERAGRQDGGPRGARVDESLHVPVSVEPLASEAKKDVRGRIAVTVTGDESELRHHSQNGSLPFGGERRDYHPTGLYTFLF